MRIDQPLDLVSCEFTAQRPNGRCQVCGDRLRLCLRLVRN